MTRRSDPARSHLLSCDPLPPTAHFPPTAHLPPTAHPQAARARGLPLVYDEVFAGLYRLGALAASRSFLASYPPDVAVYGKLLTGGAVPLAATLASEDVFRAFQGDSKVGPRGSSSGRMVGMWGAPR
jgi:adenosylmethionine-8-amino-7-oxononanoate aminotransferase